MCPSTKVFFKFKDTLIPVLITTGFKAGLMNTIFTYNYCVDVKLTLSIHAFFYEFTKLYKSNRHSRNFKFPGFRNTRVSKDIRISALIDFLVPSTQQFCGIDTILCIFSVPNFTLNMQLRGLRCMSPTVAGYNIAKL